MSNNQTKHVQMARSFSAEELEQRQAAARTQQLEGHYKPSQYHRGAWVFPCAEKVSFNSFEAMLAHTQEMVKSGRELYFHDAPEHMGTYYAASFWRSQDEIEAILAASDIEVEKQYRAEIDEHNAAQTSLLAEQLYQAQKAKEEKIQREKEDKAKQKALEEAQAFIAQQLKEGAK